MPRWGYDKGDPWIKCQVCIWKVRMSTIRKMWPGIWACPKCWDPRPYDSLPPYKPHPKEGAPAPRGMGNPADTETTVTIPPGFYDPSTYDPNKDYE